MKFYLIRHIGSSQVIVGIFKTKRSAETKRKRLWKEDPSDCLEILKTERNLV